MNATVASMLEIVRPDIDLIASMDTNAPEPCESPYHETDTHSHEGPGAYLVLLDCGCPIKVLCEKIIQRAATLFDGKLTCGQHEKSTRIIAAVPLH